jgi:DNA-binding transcriptional MocR family regulator
MANVNSYGQYIVPSSDEMINFGVGQPYSKALPIDLIKNGMLDFINNEHDSAILQYGYKSGYESFRNDLGKFISDEINEEVDPSSLFITNGVTGALNLICSVFGYNKRNHNLHGTVLIIEDPTYFLALNIFLEFGFFIETVDPTKDYVKQVEKILNKYHVDTYNVMLYTIPTFQNPTNYTMPDSVRKDLVELTYKFKGFTIIADEVYQFLYFNKLNKPPKPLFYYGGNVISIGSFSKILSPAIRLGWIQTNKTLYKRLDDCGIMESGGSLNPIGMRIIQPLFKDESLVKYVDACRQFLFLRGNYMYDMLVQYLAEFCDFYRPLGGYFIWIKMKNHKADSKKMLDIAIKNKVRYHFGEKFSGALDANRYFRLSFSWYDLDDIKTGVMRLRTTMQEYLSTI